MGKKKEEDTVFAKRKWFFAILLLTVLAALWGLLYAIQKQLITGRADVNAGKVRGMRVDPGYLYGTYWKNQGAKDAASAANLIVTDAKANGVDTIFFLTYNSVYGAYYPTNYPDTIVEGTYGSGNILRNVLDKAHANGIKVVAWLPINNFKKPWDDHSDWRSKTKSGSDYKPDPDTYFLSVWHDSFRGWYKGFLDDLFTRYPDLDGIEAAEGVIDWNWDGSADYNPVSNQKYSALYPNGTLGDQNWKLFRAQGLTELHQMMTKIAHAKGKHAFVVQTWTARNDSTGSLMNSSEIRDGAGFDFDGIMNLTSDRPDYLSAELIWQQWKNDYNNPVFTPDWTKAATQNFVSKVAGRVTPLSHVELSAFGSIQPSNTDFQTSLQHALNESAGAEFYDYNLAKTKNVLGNVKTVYSTSTSGDTTPPTISSVQATNITASSTSISWTTNEPATTQVEYGSSSSYGQSTPADGTLVTTHSVNLSGLQATTIYHYRAKSTDGANNQSVSADQTFTTASATPDTTAPTISGVTAGNITQTGATVTWTTNEGADSQVEYGTSTSYGQLTPLDTKLVTNHSATLSGLAASTTYHYRVRSRDAAGNLAVSGDQTVVTQASNIGKVTGSVKDPSGNPENNVQVRALQNSSVVKSTRSGANGAFQMDLATGTYTIEAKRGNSKANKNVTVQASTTVTVDLTLP